MSLLDKIKSNIDKVQAQQQQQATFQPSQTEQTQALLRAKATGKALDSSALGTPRSTSIAEDLAKAQGFQNFASLAEQITLSKENISAQQQQLKAEQTFIETNIQQEQNKLTQEYFLNEEKLLNEYNNKLRELDFKKDAVLLEQLGHKIRMTNAYYIDNLTREATKSRLNEEARFEEELMRSIFKDELDLLYSDLEFKSLILSDDLNFKKMARDIDIDFSLRLAKLKEKGERAVAIAQGIAGVSSAAISAAANKDDNEQE